MYLLAFLIAVKIFIPFAILQDIAEDKEHPVP
jgi:hypothetical protein